MRLAVGNGVSELLGSGLSALCVTLAACGPREKLPPEAVTCGDVYLSEPAGVVHGGLLPDGDGAALSVTLDLGGETPGPSRCVNVLLEAFDAADGEMLEPLAQAERWVRVEKTDGQWRTAAVRLPFEAAPMELTGRDVQLVIHTRSERGGTEIRLDRTLKLAKETESLPEPADDCSGDLKARKLELVSGGQVFEDGLTVRAQRGFQGADMLTPTLSVTAPTGDVSPQCAAVRLGGTALGDDGRTTHRQILSGGVYEMLNDKGRWVSGALFYPIFGVENGQRLTLDALVVGEGFRASHSVEVVVEL